MKQFRCVCSFASLVRGAALLGAFAVAACAPLQQAPLVYTSGVTVGIKLGVSPTQADAFEAVVGVKVLDAAYVPVAVSKPEAMGTDGKLATVHEIYGRFGEEITPEAVRQLNATEMDAVRNYLAAASEASVLKSNRDAAASKYATASEAFAKAKQVKERAEKTVEDARMAVDNLPEEVVSACKLSDATLSQTKSTQLGSTEDQNALRKVIDECLNATNLSDTQRDVLQRAQQLLQNALSDASISQLSNDFVSAQRQVHDEEARLKQAMADLAVAEKNLTTKEKSAMEALQKLSNIRKRDALSVYGSFNNQLDLSRDTKSPKLDSKLGKVFSTGVAAQNLTEAARISVVAEAYAECVSRLKDVTSMLADGKREAFLQRAIEQCGVGAKNAVAEKKN